MLKELSLPIFEFRQVILGGHDHLRVHFRPQIRAQASRRLKCQKAAEQFKQPVKSRLIQRAGQKLVN